MHKNVRPALTSILNEIPGWAADTFGGRDRSLHTVTVLADEGPGSLRAALESPEPLWIAFACDSVSAQLREDTDDHGHWPNENNHWRLTWGWLAFKRATSVDDEVFAGTTN